MILLEFANRIIEETLNRAFTATKPEAYELTIADFDGVTYHIFTPEGGPKTTLLVSMSMPCINDLLNFGVGDAINGIYGAFVTDTEGGYDVTLCFDITTLPANSTELAHEVALLKRNVLSAPFETYFDNLGADMPTCEIKYRDAESIFLKQGRDGVTCVFSIEFKDADDIVFAKVFLQEFKDAKRSINSCPPVSYTTKEPPMELQGERVRTGDNIGFVTIVVQERHMSAQRRGNSISLLQTFRDYLHYHIKCSKAYMHTRMRARVQSLLKILNRAKIEPAQKEKKTASGRTFRR